jgi:ArsR family transcriptional regulator
MISRVEVPALACCGPIATPRMAPEDARAAAQVFRALSDPNRVRILNLIASSPVPVCVCDLQAPLGLSQPTVSFHLKKLASAGWIRGQRRGTWVFYSLEPGALERVRAIFEPEGAR